jgi:G:T-mismatch repair DNA endonuclease (very short patch repair protein)
MDGFCKETNTIYEFHGDFWHGNPSIYDKDQLNPINKKSFGELYQQTIKKEEHLKQLGYTVVVMWESKWNKINQSIRMLQRQSIRNPNPIGNLGIPSADNS